METYIFTLYHLLQVSLHRASLQHTVDLKSQYERMLQEFAEYLETAQSKLRPDGIAALNLPHLKQLLETHKVRASWI